MNMVDFLLENNAALYDQIGILTIENQILKERCQKLANELMKIKSEQNKVEISYLLDKFKSYFNECDCPGRKKSIDHNGF